MSTINTVTVNGRFANAFINNMCGHFIAKKYNIRFKYAVMDKMYRLGVFLFVEGIHSFSDCPTIVLQDPSFFEYIKDDPTTENLKANFVFGYNTYCQTKEHVKHIRDYFYTNNLFERSIIPMNPYKDRYQQNNDVYIHVRLGDVIELNPGVKYYDHVLSQLSFTNGYISSDTITHPICEELIFKYGLEIIDEDLVKTIQYASTCKYVVLSNGTFSWLIGLFSLYSTVYYPKLDKDWPDGHGDIYAYPEWIEIDTTQI